MYRRLARPYGPSVSNFRVISMLMGALVLGMLYFRLKDPTTWSAFAVDDSASTKQAVLTDGPETETVVPGPNDLDETEVEDAQADFEKVIDRAPIKTREWDAYWRLMSWSRSQSFADLERRAKDDVPFTQLWEQPDKYRGKPIRLRLHVRRVLTYEASENSTGITELHEAWGWTDESRSLTFPYAVVFPEPPKGLPVGGDVRTEIVFVGYFLKIMSYSAINPNNGAAIVRGAPLLLGRAQLVPSPTVAAPSKTDPWIIALVVVGGIVFIGFSIMTGMKTRGKTRRQMLPDNLAEVDSTMGNESSNPFELLGLGQPPEIEQNLKQPMTVSAGEASPPDSGGSK